MSGSALHYERMAANAPGVHPAVLVGGALAVGLGVWFLARSRRRAVPEPARLDPLRLLALEMDFDFGGPGTCLCVGGSFQDRCNAIQVLVRPDEVQHIAAHLRSLGGGFVEHAARYVMQTVQYEPDPERCDRWCSPARTLFTGRGDCDDFAVTLAAILIAGRVSASVVLGRTAGSSEGHAWVEGYDEAGYLFAEPQSGEVLRTRPGRYVAEHVLALGYCAPCAA